MLIGRRGNDVTRLRLSTCSRLLGTVAGRHRYVGDVIVTVENRRRGYSAGVSLLNAVPVVGVATALAGAVMAVAPSPAVDVVPVLTSSPFGALPGQPVTHTITLSGNGAGALTAVRVTFTTTVGLDGVTASASQGSCPIVTALTVVCELGNVELSGADAATPTVTITGTVHAGTAPGTLVQNLVNVTSGVPDADPTNNVANNAYLIPGADPARVRASASESNAVPRRSREVVRRTANPVPVLAAVLVLVGLAAARLIVVWRRHRRS
jgi:Domain of unknown function DUF11